MLLLWEMRLGGNTPYYSIPILHEYYFMSTILHEYNIIYTGTSRVLHVLWRRSADGNAYQRYHNKNVIMKTVSTMSLLFAANLFVHKFQKGMQTNEREHYIWYSYNFKSLSLIIKKGNSWVKMKPISSVSNGLSNFGWSWLRMGYRANMVKHEQSRDQEWVQNYFSRSVKLHKITTIYMNKRTQL